MFENEDGVNRGDWPYVGTLEYISPEVVMSQRVPDGFGCSSPDIWAAGESKYTITQARLS